MPILFYTESMPLYFIVAITILNIISLLGLYAVLKRTKHITKSIVQVIGVEHEDIAEPFSLRATKIAYATFMCVLVAASYVIFIKFP